MQRPLIGQCRRLLTFKCSQICTKEEFIKLDLKRKTRALLYEIVFIQVKITFFFFFLNCVGKFAFNGGERWAMWKNGWSQRHWLVCVVNFLLPSAPRSSIDSLLSEARAICITYSPLSLPVASSTVYSERSRPSWIAQLLGHVDSPVHGWALIALVYAGSGCVQSSLLSVP